MKSNYEILGLPEGSDKKVVEKKYGALLRQYKQRTDEAGVTDEDAAYYETITRAYDSIMGYTHDYSDDDPTSVIPRPIRRAWSKWCIFFDHYRLLLFLGIFLVALGTMIFLQLRDNRKEDLMVKFVGAYSTLDTKQFHEEVAAKSQTTDYPTISFFTVTTDTVMNPSAQSQATQFYAQLLQGTLDVILLDRESYDVYVEEMAFLPLDAYLDDFSSLPGYSSDKVLSYEPSEESKVPAGVYGIDITECGFFDGTQLDWLHAGEQKKSMILTICYKTKRKDQALSFAKELMGAESMAPEVTG